MASNRRGFLAAGWAALMGVGAIKAVTITGTKNADGEETTTRHELPPPPLLEWHGWTTHGIAPAWSILQATNELDVATSEEEALQFYRGAQWPEAVVEKRQADKRPTLVVNRLPELVAAALAEEQRTTGRSLNERQLRALQIIVAVHNRDAQMLFNYQASARAERG